MAKLTQLVTLILYICIYIFIVSEVDLQPSWLTYYTLFWV